MLALIGNARSAAALPGRFFFAVLEEPCRRAVECQGNQNSPTTLVDPITNRHRNAQD